MWLGDDMTSTVSRYLCGLGTNKGVFRFLMEIGNGNGIDYLP